MRKFISLLVKNVRALTCLGILQCDEINYEHKTIQLFSYKTKYQHHKHNLNNIIYEHPQMQH